MLKIRRPLGRLIFNMGIAIPGKTVFLIETAPRVRFQMVNIPRYSSVDVSVIFQPDTRLINVIYPRFYKYLRRFLNFCHHMKSGKMSSNFSRDAMAY